MFNFLERAYPDMRTPNVHYVQRTAPGDDLPLADNGNPYVPYALTAAGDVVYAPYGAHTGWNANTGLRRYNSDASKERRHLADSALGMHALNPRFTRTAVNRVADGVRVALRRPYSQDSAGTMALVFDEIGRYFYNNTRHNFGRLEDVPLSTKTHREVWDGINTALRTGRIDQKMAIIDTVGTKLIRTLADNIQADYAAVANIEDRRGLGRLPNGRRPAGDKIREAWMNDDEKRGRVHHDVAAVTNGGTAPQNAQIPATVIARKRGADMFSRDANRTSSPGGDRYFSQLDLRNLTFGASLSGTTGTLLQAGVAFGGLNGEDLKQFLFAIVGYLVGGGMHTFHESLEVARRLGIPYQPGKYEQSLPLTFVGSREYRQWRERYYDVAVLGATHWRYNCVNGGRTHTRRLTFARNQCVVSAMLIGRQ